MRNLIAFGLLFSSIGLVTPAHAAKAKAAAAPEKAKRTDRTLLKSTLADLRVHSRGDELLKNTDVKQLQLSNGAKVLFSYTNTNNRGYSSGNFHVYGKAGSGDAAVVHLNAKERVEIGKLLESTRDAHNNGIRITVDKVSPALIKMVRSAGVEQSPVAKSNYEVLKSIIPAIQ